MGRMDGSASAWYTCTLPVLVALVPTTKPLLVHVRSTQQQLVRLESIVMLVPVVVTTPNMPVNCVAVV